MTAYHLVALEHHKTIDFTHSDISSYLIIFTIYCLIKISIRAKRSISRVFSLVIVPSPFLYIARTNAVLTGVKAY